MVANKSKNNQGVTDFEAHAMKTSGGINPKAVSEIKKNEKMIWGEYVATKLFKNVFISRTNSSSPRIIKTKTIVVIPPFTAISFKNG